MRSPLPLAERISSWCTPRRDSPLSVTDEVKALYPNETLEFGTDYLIPKPFDRRLLVEVSSAVAAAAMDSGVARKRIDLAAYRASFR